MAAAAAFDTLESQSLQDAIGLILGLAYPDLCPCPSFGPSSPVSGLQLLVSNWDGSNRDADNTVHSDGIWIWGLQIRAAEQQVQVFLAAA